MTTTETQPNKNDNTLALASMIMGILSMAGFGFLLGIPAIVTGVIALKQKRGDRGYGLTGLITGIVSTVLSVLAVIALIFFFVLAASAPHAIPADNNNNPQYQREWMQRS